jgi:hypothetical protein
MPFMVSCCRDIVSYYRDIVATTTGIIDPANNRASKKILTISRFEFGTGAGLACGFLIQTIALSIFHFVGVILTCGRQASIQSFWNNFKEVFVYLGAIPVGFIGVIIPGTINQSFLGIPPNGLTVLL